MRWRVLPSRLFEMSPSVLILLATYNGAQWLDEQLQSFADQRDVTVRVVVSDDQSTDETLEILKAWSARLDIIVLPDAGRRFGNANRNFMRLVRDTPLGGTDYVCFSDQDDIWSPDKLERATRCLQAEQADAYSSDVLAFWEDGRERVVTKSQPQRPLDHLFESAGPGCTFVFPRSSFDELRQWASANADALDEVRVHDWAIYAFGRQSGWRWVIDSVSGLAYRQHSSNEIGANVGLKSALKRFGYLLGGRYREDIIRTAKVVGHQSPDLDRLLTLRLIDRLALAARARMFRRKTSDAAVLAFVFLLMR